jgi:nicotinate-nucleotide pyrophosphorylase (carboxylating)
MVAAALKEDIGAGDVTTRAFVPTGARIRAKIVARQPGVACGLGLAAYAFEKLGGKSRLLARDGERVKPGRAVLEVTGAAGVLTAERVALNFLQKLSGIATLTRAYVDAAGPIVFDTRKTTPLWRDLEKYAVRCGGGRNHRTGLYDAGLMKDNHWASLGDWPGAAEKFRCGVADFRRRNPGMLLEVEIEDDRQLRLALDCGVDAVLLDNMDPKRLARAIEEIRSRKKPPLIEVSGGVNLGTIAAAARLRPDRISIGRLTHSAPALDFGLDMTFR